MQAGRVRASPFTRDTLNYPPQRTCRERKKVPPILENYSERLKWTVMEEWTLSLRR
jgi:hypothetical protein